MSCHVKIKAKESFLTCVMLSYFVSLFSISIQRTRFFGLFLIYHQTPPSPLSSVLRSVVFNEQVSRLRKISEFINFGKMMFVRIDIF